jgi:hypothetical protein
VRHGRRSVVSRMQLQRVLNTVSLSLALGLVALAAWHVNHPETFVGSALLQVPPRLPPLTLVSPPALLLPWPADTQQLSHPSRPRQRAAAQTAVVFFSG